MDTLNALTENTYGKLMRNKMREDLPTYLIPFNDAIISYAFVGSRETCVPAPTDTDLDVLVYTTKYGFLLGGYNYE